VNTRQDIQEFLAQKTIALAGASRDEKAFSAAVSKELKAKGYRVLPVNPHAGTIAGEPCYPSLAALPERVGGVVVFTPPAETEKVVRDAAAQGITRVWLQQGTVSAAALEVCREKGMQAVSGKCIMMFAEPVSSIHGVHRWFAKVFGQLPK
jgi:predicted CoA-binding protein